MYEHSLKRILLYSNAYVYVQTYTCIFKCTYLYSHICIYSNVCTHMQIIPVYSNIYTYSQTYTSIFKCINVYSHTHTHTHTVPPPPTPRGGNGNLLKHSCLKNAMDRGAHWATIHGAAKSGTRLNNVGHTHPWCHVSTVKIPVISLLNVVCPSCSSLPHPGSR